MASPGRWWSRRVAAGPQPRGRRWPGLLGGLLIATAALGGGAAVRFLPRSFLAGRVATGPPSTTYRYDLVGNPGDVAPRTEPGMVLCGGGTDLDEAFRWMIGRSGGGDFLVVRTTGTDAYNDYIYDMTAPDGARPDSVATLIIPTREAAHDPFVLAKLREAEAIWIAGGDQAIHFASWRGTPVAAAIDAAAAGRIPVGGTSSGLAVMGEFLYSAAGDHADAPHLTSTEALEDPYGPRVTLGRDFLHLPHLGGVLLEPHFMQESRYGRMATFLSRIAREGWAGAPCGLGIERKTALLVEPDGRARVIAAPGHSLASVTAFRLVGPPEACEPGRALTARGIELIRIAPGGTLDLRTWAATGGTSSRLRIERGRPVVEAPSGAERAIVVLGR